VCVIERESMCAQVLCSIWVFVCLNCLHVYVYFLMQKPLHRKTELFLCESSRVGEGTK